MLLNNYNFHSLLDFSHYIILFKQMKLLHSVGLKVITTHIEEEKLLRLVLLWTLHSEDTQYINK